MTLSLDDVQKKRFRMARKSGYEVLEVDEFVDQVEAAFEQLIGENDNLKQQIEALQAAPTTQPTAAAGDGGSESAPPQTIVVTTSKEASSAVVRLVELSTDHAEQLVEEATVDAGRIREEANRSAHQVTTDARTRAERIESEARVSAERVQGDALGRAEALDRDIDTRRSQMFGDLEQQRDQLSDTVRSLRSFEASYRSNLGEQLRQQIAQLESVSAEPADAPPLSVRAESTGSDPGAGSAPGDDGDGDLRHDLDDDEAPTAGGGSRSETPRLDALLGDQR